jgi:hypothetical protein
LLPTLAVAASSREPRRSRNRSCPATAACELRPRSAVAAASSRLSPAIARTSTRAQLPSSLLAVEEELEGKLSIQSSTSSFSTGVEIHKRHMARSSAPNLSQFMPLLLVGCKYYQIQVVWFKSKANNIIYKCPNNHKV